MFFKRRKVLSYETMYEKQRSFMDVQEMIFDGEVTSSITGYTDTASVVFTPTTLASFEAELGNVILSSHSIPSHILMTEASGNMFFSAPLTTSTTCSNMDDYDDDDDSSSMDSNSNFAGVATKNFSVISSSKVGKPLSKEVCAVKPVEQKQRKLPGPRPSKPIEEMTPLEAERRRRRRERNKNAAAKCRQRRLEQTTELTEETEMLEREQERLEREIENLRRMKSQLEFVLESHKPTCLAMPAIENEANMDAIAASVSNVCVVRPSNLPLPAAYATGRSHTATTTSAGLDGYIFSFDTPLAGLTPVMAAANDLNSPSQFILFSP